VPQRRLRSEISFCRSLLTHTAMPLEDDLRQRGAIERCGNCLGKQAGAARGRKLAARGNVDAVAHQVAIALLDHVAQTDADAELDATLRRKTRVALDHALRKGAQGLAQSMQQQMGQGPGPGRSGRLGQPRAQQDTDPLGRPLRGREYGDDYTVKVPGEIDVQRARRRASVRSSSDPASFLNLTTSAARRLRVSGSPPWQSLHHTPD
jgi:hypothetical protein